MAPKVCKLESDQSSKRRRAGGNVLVSLTNDHVIGSVVQKTASTRRGRNWGSVTVPKRVTNPGLGMCVKRRERKRFPRHVGDTVTIKLRNSNALIYAVTEIVSQENGKPGASVMLNVNRKGHRTELNRLSRKQNVAAKNASRITSIRLVMADAVPSTAFLETGACGQIVQENVGNLTGINTGIYRSQNVEG